MSVKSTSDYYNSHWARFATLEYPQAKLLQVDLFFTPIKNLITANQKLLDIGCGNGVHWHYLKRMKKFAIQITGVDISQKTIDFLTESISDPNDVFFKMDACDLQFEDEIFDYVISYGVIGYTDSPRKAIEEMFRVCKPGGLIGIFIPEITGLNRLILERIRRISKRLSKKGQEVLANFLVPFFGFAPSETNISLRNATWHQVQEVILTDIAPPHLIFISYQTLLEWLKEMNISIFFDDKTYRSKVWVKKY